VFSESEIDLYVRELGIARARLHFVPLGDWGQRRQPVGVPEPGGYYFAGGRSNREYRALVEAFRGRPERLVIICGSCNRDDFRGLELPPNVTVLFDVPIESFDEYTRSAKAGIVVLRRDAGSSGQSVALSLMRNAKCVIVNKAGALRGYVEHGVSGFVLSDVARELPAVIEEIESGGVAAKMGLAARTTYERRFSRAAAVQALDEVLGI
jgi:hypothetical protein